MKHAYLPFLHLLTVSVFLVFFLFNPQVKAQVSTTTIKSSDNEKVLLEEEKALADGKTNIHISKKNNDLVINVNDTLFDKNKGGLLLSVFVITGKDTNIPIASEKISYPEISINLNLLMQDISSAVFVIWIYDYIGNGMKRKVSVLRDDDGHTFHISDDVNLCLD